MRTGPCTDLASAAGSSQSAATGIITTHVTAATPRHTLFHARGRGGGTFVPQPA